MLQKSAMVNILNTKEVVQDLKLTVRDQNAEANRLAGTGQTARLHTAIHARDEAERLLLINEQWVKQNSLWARFWKVFFGLG